MFATPREIAERREAVLRDAAAQKLTAEEAGRRILEIDSDDPTGLMAMGSSLMAAGDLDGAEPLFWRALAGAPANPGYYLTLAALARTRGETGLSAALAVLATWKLSFYEEIPESLLGKVKQSMPDLGDAAEDPATYRALAEHQERELAWPERLLPYRLLNEVQKHAAGGLDPDLIRDIVANPDLCAPLFRAAIHEAYDSMTSSLSHEAETLLIALLGEVAPVDWIDDLLTSGAGSEEDVFLHAQWAIRRLGERFPAEADARLRTAMRAAGPDIRAAIAQQFAFLKDLPGRRQAVLSTLDGFAAFAQEEESPFLLLTVSVLLSMMGATADANVVLKRHERQLSKEGREMMREAMDADEPWMPELTLYGVNQVDIEGICVDLALMEAPEEDESDAFDDELDGEAEEPAPAAKLGRNDPCWCGSGKKYKKCHLNADEEAARQQPKQDADQDLFHAAWDELIGAAAKFHTRRDVDAAFHKYFDREQSEMDPEAVAESGFFIWYLLDYVAPSSGRTAIEEFVRRRGPRLTDRMLGLLEAWRVSRYGLFEALRVEEGRGLEIKDVHEGDTFFVDDPETSRTAEDGVYMIGRTYRFEDKWRFTGDGFFVPPPVLRSIHEAVEEGRQAAGVSAGSYFRSRSHDWRPFVLEEHQDLLDEAGEGDGAR